jgi:DNA-binding MurR/RpiR family transcriptional regulator
VTGAGPPIDERIARHLGSLSPQERRAAEVILAHLDDLASYRAVELAALSGVSKATMSRLFRSLGYAGFGEVREHLRLLRDAGEPRQVHGPPDLAAHGLAEDAAIARALGQPAVPGAVEALSRASRVLVAGWRNSYPVALHLRQQLIQARPLAALAPVPGQVAGEELAGLGPGDAIVAVGFRRRPAGFGEFVTTAAGLGATVIVIADPTGAAHLTRADFALECPIGSSLAFDSYAAAASLAAVLADGVLRRRGQVGQERVSAISAVYERLRELE